MMKNTGLSETFVVGLSESKDSSLYPQLTKGMLVTHSFIIDQTKCKVHPAYFIPGPGVAKCETMFRSLEAIPGRVKTNRGCFVAFSSLLKTNPAELKTNPADLKANPARLKTNPAELKTNPARLKTNSAELKTNPARLKTNPAELKTNSARLKTNPAELETNSARLKTNPAELETNPARRKTNPAELKTNPARLEKFPGVLNISGKSRGISSWEHWKTFSSRETGERYRRTAVGGLRKAT